MSSSATDDPTTSYRDLPQAPRSCVEPSKSLSCCPLPKISEAPSSPPSSSVGCRHRCPSVIGRIQSWTTPAAASMSSAPTRSLSTTTPAPLLTAGLALCQRASSTETRYHGARPTVSPSPFLCPKWHHQPTESLQLPPSTFMKCKKTNFFCS
jgi:hypothetical protein